MLGKVVSSGKPLCSEMSPQSTADIGAFYIHVKYIISLQMQKIKRSSSSYWYKIVEECVIMSSFIYLNCANFNTFDKIECK